MLRRSFVCSFIILLCAGLGISHAGELESIRIVSSDYPPYHFFEDGKPKGAATDLLEHMAVKAGYSFDRGRITPILWAKGFELVQHSPGTMLYSTVRIPERESMFAWVGPISQTHIAVLARKGHAKPISSLKELKGHIVGVSKNDIAEFLLFRNRAAGFKIEHAPSIWASVYNLLHGHVSYIAYEVSSAKIAAERIGFSAENIEPVYTLGRQPLYYSFHKETSKSVLAALQKALDEMKKPGPDGISEHARIFASYGITP